MKRHIVVKISPNPSLPVQGQEKDAKEGEFLPFVKGGWEGFGLQRPYNYGLISNCHNLI